MLELLSPVVRPLAELLDGLPDDRDWAWNAGRGGNWVLVVGDGIEFAETDRVACDMLGRGGGCCCEGGWRGILADEGEVENSEFRSGRAVFDGSFANEVRRRIDLGGGALTETEGAADDDEELARDESELFDALRVGAFELESWLLPALEEKAGTA